MSKTMQQSSQGPECQAGFADGPSEAKARGVVTSIRETLMDTFTPNLKEDLFHNAS